MGNGSNGESLRPGTETSGPIRKLHADKGFGFVQVGKVGYFFHRSNVRGGSKHFADLREGDMVNLVIGDSGPKGERAERVWFD